METEFNFNSLPCTSIEQSTRLLAIGLKKETADMTWFRRSKNADWELDTMPYQGWVEEILPIVDGYALEDIIPAWSVLRLFEMYTGGRYCKWDMSAFKWDDLIDCIEDAIKRGYFNKNYLL